MKKITVNLTIPEFLSLHTGWLFGQSIDNIYEACEKVFRFAPYTLTMVLSAEKFQQTINQSRPDFVEMVQSCGQIKKVI